MMCTVHIPRSNYILVIIVVIINIIIIIISSIIKIIAIVLSLQISTSGMGYEEKGERRMPTI